MSKHFKAQIAYASTDDTTVQNVFFMKKDPPFSKAYAELLATEYQDLLNARFDAEHDWKIDCVAAAPADVLNQWFFANLYMDNGTVIGAAQFYNHTAYDVLLISIQNRAEHRVAFKTLRAYLKERGETLHPNVQSLQSLSSVG